MRESLETVAGSGSDERKPGNSCRIRVRREKAWKQLQDQDQTRESLETVAGSGSDERKPGNSCRMRKVTKEQR